MPFDDQRYPFQFNGNHKYFSWLCYNTCNCPDNDHWSFNQYFAHCNPYRWNPLLSWFLHIYRITTLSNSHPDNQDNRKNECFAITCFKSPSMSIKDDWMIIKLHISIDNYWHFNNNNIEINFHYNHYSRHLSLVHYSGVFCSFCVVLVVSIVSSEFSMNFPRIDIVVY